MPKTAKFFLDLRAMNRKILYSFMIILMGIIMPKSAFSGAGCIAGLNADGSVGACGGRGGPGPRWGAGRINRIPSPEEIRREKGRLETQERLLNEWEVQKNLE